MDTTTTHTIPLEPDAVDAVEAALTGTSTLGTPTPGTPTPGTATPGTATPGTPRPCTPTLGAVGEELAARHLADDDGLSVLARNWRLAAGELRGELDLVAVDGASGLVVVCEVKTRRDAQRFGGALAAVGPRKRAKVRALAGAFLRGAGLGFRTVRLDVVAIDLGRTALLTHVEDAL